MRRIILIVVLLVGASAAWFGLQWWNAWRVEQQARRQALFDAIQPVKLANCEFERFGEAGDGGYVGCRNLLDRAGAIYSYGIGGYDNWGCAMSARTKTPVHQYDCFDTTAPTCRDFPGATPVFHAECVGPERKRVSDRLFDTIAAHIERNGDAAKRLIMKMDVEGAEWASFLAAPESVLQQIDQLSVEFHTMDPDEFLATIEKLKRVFYVANLHWNNAVCDPSLKPLTSPAFEIVFVNKAIARLDPSGPPVMPNPLDAPNMPVALVPDCQAVSPAAESKSPH